MQTQYRLLYRYVNNNTNIAITDEAEYNKTEEFYSADHKINIDDNKLREMMTPVNGSTYELKYVFDGITAEDYANTLINEGTAERENLIMENMANEAKSNNLYVYTGTKKIFHKKYIPDQIGYVVRDWTRVPKEQVPDGPDDYSKHFVMLGGTQLGVDNAYLVCKPQNIKTYMKKKCINEPLVNGDYTPCFLNISSSDVDNIGYKGNSNLYGVQGSYIQDIDSIINEATFFKWYSGESNEEVQFNETAVSGSGIVKSGSGASQYLATSDPWSSPGKPKNYYNYIYFKNKNGQHQNPVTGLTPVTFSPSGGGILQEGILWNNVISKQYTYFGQYLKVGAENIIREVIPAHYEETGKAPYIIKDQYEKINLSPWMLHSVHNSLESGLTAAKTLVSMIGIDNVKLVKYVPVGQFVDIK